VDAERRGRIRAIPSTLVRFARRAPITCIVLALGWGVGILTWTLPGADARALIGILTTGPRPLGAGHWWSPVTAMLYWGGISAYLLTTAAVLVAGPVAERRIGRWRTALFLIGTQVAGTLLVSAFVQVGVLFDRSWVTVLGTQQMTGAAPGAVGLGLATSAALSALWRRRLRVVLLTVPAMLVAYSGQLADVVLLAAALIGLVTGAWVFGHRRDWRPGPASRNETRVLVAIVVAATAIGPVIAAAAHTPIGPLAVLRFLLLSPAPDPDAVVQACANGINRHCRAMEARQRLFGFGPALASALPVIVLLVIAEGLRRGRRAAWVLGMAVNVVLAALGVWLGVLIANTPDEAMVAYTSAPGARAVLATVVPALVPSAVAALLWLTREQFEVKAPSRTYRRTAALAAAMFVGLSACYVVVGLAVSGQFDTPPTALALLADVPLRFLPPGYLGEVAPSFLPQGPVATLMSEWVGVVFWLVVVVGLLAGFVRARMDPAGADSARARAILVEHGGADLAWITTWAGNSYWFTDPPDAAVAYRVIGGVALTTGDPVGSTERRAAAVAGFVATCAERGWIPAFYSVTDGTRTACAALGLRSVQVAEEIVLPLAGLSFTGKRWQDVRTALNKAGKQGITGEWLSYAKAPLAITDQIRAISEEWVADKGLPEMGFTLGGLPELADDAVRVLVAVDTDRTVHGVTSWMPVHRDGAIVGWTLDFMRRRSGPEAFRGVSEFLVASAARDLQEEGAQFLSLSGSPLARQDRGGGDAPPAERRRSDQRFRLERVLDGLGAALEPIYGFRSLHAFKAKFQPEYAPLHLCYPDPAALPSIGLAIGRAYVPHIGARQSAKLLARLRRGSPEDRSSNVRAILSEAAADARPDARTNSVGGRS